MTPLSNLKPTETGRVAFIDNDQKACQRLLDMGLTCDTPIRVVNAAPFHGPLELEVRGTRLALDRKLAGKVFIRIEPDRTASERVSTS